MLTKAQLEELRTFDTPTVCNAIECFGIRSNTQGYTLPGALQRTGAPKPIVGYVATAKVSGLAPAADAHENLMGYYAHVREMGEPTIAVIQDVDPDRVAAFWGEVQATVHLSLGCVGTLIEGGVRDLEEVNGLGFPMYATDLCVAHGYTHVVRYNCPVRVRGLEILPGELLHMDRHGAVIIPSEIAPHLAAMCRTISRAELPMLEPCRRAIQEGYKPSMAQIEQWRKDMVAARSGDA